ncbi:YceI family protein [Reichenbachiella sp. MALMAid0571]|uniref:YceI family protein n=1 Tax=Reichenbachiella sp. MALMAid0571 TaxID=3143939 RepID=UPI0032DF0735
MKLLSHSICIYLILTFLPTTSSGQETDLVMMVLSNKSNLTISGTSNISKFDCKLEQNFEQDTLIILTKYSESNLLCENAVTTFLVNKFNCGHEAINRDFRDALREKEFPEISLNVKNIYQTANIDINNLSKGINAEVSLMLAGTKKEYKIGFEKNKIEAKELCFSGEKTVKMSDFNIDPPKALMGLIKTNDDLSIQFDLRLILLNKVNIPISNSISKKD